VLKLCGKYKGDVLAETLYGRVLASIQLGRTETARKEMKDAFKHCPLVAKELIKTEHKKPKSKMEGFITLGGEDEAYEYWRDFGRLWEKTPGAVRFIREFMAGTSK
jgi:hypothetical protein